MTLCQHAKEWGICFGILVFKKVEILEGKELFFVFVFFGLKKGGGSIVQQECYLWDF